MSYNHVMAPDLLTTVTLLGPPACAIIAGTAFVLASEWPEGERSGARRRVGALGQGARALGIAAIGLLIAWMPTLFGLEESPWVRASGSVCLGAGLILFAWSVLLLLHACRRTAAPSRAVHPTT